MMRALLVGLVAVMLGGCRCQNETQPNPAPSASTPKIYFSSQPWVRGNQPVVVGGGPTPPDAAAPELLGTEAGEKLHPDAAKDCADHKCSGPKCERLCGQWVAERGAEIGSAARKNQVYFNCVGACIAGPKAK